MRILLIEDDAGMVAALDMSLSRLGHRVAAVGADPGDSLPDLVGDADAVVLDIGLPGIDGFGICRRIRRFSQVPIVMLTARGDDIDMVAGLEAGADDYVVKPVSARVLEARIKANVRRAAEHTGPEGPGTAAGAAVVERFGDLEIDRAAAQVRQRDTEVHLSPTERRLVLAFADHPGQVLSRDQLLELAWDHTYLGDSRLVDNAVQRL